MQKSTKKKQNKRSKTGKQRKQKQSQSYQLPANINQPRKVIFKYCAAISRSNSTTAVPYIFGSSLYDPDYSGTGGQPYNYDQMTTLYSYYRVDRMVVYVEVMNTSTAPIIAAVFPSTTSSLNTALVTQFMQYPSSSWATIGAVTGGNNIHRFKKTLVPHVMLNLPMTDDSLKAYFAASPTASVFCSVTHQHSDLSTSATAVYSIQIDFYATMMNLQNPGDSLTSKVHDCQTEIDQASVGLNGPQQQKSKQVEQSDKKVKERQSTKKPQTAQQRSSKLVKQPSELSEEEYTS